MEKDQARKALEELVDRYGQMADRAHKMDGGYPEEQARVDFIDPMLVAFGWDLRNQANLPHSTREVLVEPTLTQHDDESGRPDYTLRPDGTTRLFIEAKRPAIDLNASQSSARQVRKYGWSAGLGVSILTNFRSLVVYDTRFQPEPTDGPEVARIPGLTFIWDEYVDRFDELWTVLSRDAVGSDDFLIQFGQEREYRGRDSFDQRFLDRVRNWRRRIAEGIAASNTEMSARDIGRRTQQILNSLVFLRVCEDRSLTTYAELRTSATRRDLVGLFADSDRRFNAGLFRALVGLPLPEGLLEEIVDELYYPNSPYAFSVVEPAMLASIYEQFLGERVMVDGGGAVTLVAKPEVLHNGGVAPTPAFLVAELVESFDASSGDHAAEEDPPIICDPACGSGPFLLAAFRALLAVVEQQDGSKGGIGLARKRQLLLKSIYGVDIDDQAVEVTRLSLLLALLDGETTHTIAAEPPPVLPDLSGNIQVGNSLVGPEFHGLFPELATDTALLTEISVFDWHAAFPGVFGEGGFDFIVGNPPWVRIQVLSEFFPDQLRFFQRPQSGFDSSQAHNFDLYMLFVEKSLKLLAPGGTLAFVLPHRFMTSLAGRPLRALLAQGGYVRTIVHFGHEQLFPGRQNYACLLVVENQSRDTFTFERVTDVDRWRRNEDRAVVTKIRGDITADPWTFVDDASAAVFARLRRDFPKTLREVADIFVGVQTSADTVLLPVPVAVGKDYVVVETDDGSTHRIEKAITRPAIRDRRLEPFDERPVPDVVAIFPYELEDQPRRAKVIPPDRMAAEFPNCWAYLQLNRPRLEARALQGGAGDTWYRYGRSQSLTLLDDPKIIVRVMSTVPRYAFDPDGLVAPGGGDGGPYYFIRPLLDRSAAYHRYVIAVLSHPVIDALVVANGRAFRGGFYVHRKAFLQDLPMAEPGDALPAIAAAVEATSLTVVSLRTETETSRRRALEQLLTTQKQRVQDLVSELYRISPDELAAFDL